MLASAVTGFQNVRVINSDLVYTFPGLRFHVGEDSVGVFELIWFNKRYSCKPDRLQVPQKAEDDEPDEPQLADGIDLSSKSINGRSKATEYIAKSESTINQC